MDEETNLEQLANEGGNAEDLPEGGDAEQNEGPAPEVIAKAKEMGWAPKEAFRGDPEKWVDADVYVQRGEELLPLIRANNRRLAEQLSARDNELAQTKKQLKDMQDSISALTEIQTREATGRVDRQIAVTQRQIEDARQERDTDKVLELTGQLDALKVEREKLSKPAVKTAVVDDDEDEDDDGTAEATPQVRQEIRSWIEDQSEWYGVDKLRTKLVNATAAEMRADPKNKNLVGKAFLDKVLAEVDEELGERKPQRKVVDKTAGGSNNGARSGGSSAQTRGKSYADLPADAKAACESDIARVVGENKVFKKPEAYRAYFVKEFFGA